MHLTKNSVAAIAPPPRKQADGLLIWDDSLAGFGVRVMPSGRRSFIYQGRIRGRERRITMKPPFPLLSVAEARLKAQEMKIAMAHGDDPMLARRADRDQPTFADLAAHYFEDAKLRGLKSAAELERKLAKHAKPLMNHLASQIQRSDIARLHAKIAKDSGLVIANRMLVLIGTIFNRAMDQGLFKGENPARRIKRYREHARTRFLTSEELKRVNEALMAEPNLYWRSFFQLALLLGPRKNELLSARWADIDLAVGTWRLPTTKSGREHLLPLPDAARAIFETLHKLSGSQEWVFPSAAGLSGHLVEPRRAWVHIRERAGVKDVTIHDLRRTLGSWLASHGQSLPMIGRVLGHTSPSSTAIYARLAVDAVKQALEENAARMLGGDERRS
jgi:integrase